MNQTGPPQRKCDGAMTRQIWALRGGGTLPEGWRVGEIGGVEIRANFSLAIIAALITSILTTRILPGQAPGQSGTLYLIAGVFAAGVFIGSIVWHEMAHALLAMRYGIPVKRIVLHLFGGVAYIARDPERPEHEFWIAVAGPASSLVLAAGFGALSGLPGIAGAACGWLALINLTLALFNLLPGFPLDGGRILRAALWRAGGSYRRATRQASRVGQTMAGLFVLLALWTMLEGLLFNGIWFLLIAAFVYAAATASYRMAAGQTLSLKAPVQRVMRLNIPVVEATMPLALLAWRYLDHAHDQAFPVVEAGRLVGLVSAAQLAPIPRLEWGRFRVGQVMLPRERLCLFSPDDDLGTALAALDAAGIDHAPVFEGGHLVGMLNRRDIVYRT